MSSSAIGRLFFAISLNDQTKTALRIHLLNCRNKFNHRNSNHIPVSQLTPHESTNHDHSKGFKYVQQKTLNRANDDSQPNSRNNNNFPQSSTTTNALSRELKGILPGSIVSSENWHITLKFLGHTTQQQFDLLCHHLSNKELIEPFSIRFKEFGCFDKPENAKVLWVGIDKGVDQLSILSDSINEIANQLGFENGNKKFVPHLTISRLHKSTNVTHILDNLQNFECEQLVDEIVLYHSNNENPGYKRNDKGKEFKSKKRRRRKKNNNVESIETEELYRLEDDHMDISVLFQDESITHYLSSDNSITSPVTTENSPSPVVHSKESRCFHDHSLESSQRHAQLSRQIQSDSMDFSDQLVLNLDSIYCDTNNSNMPLTHNYNCNKPQSSPKLYEPLVYAVLKRFPLRKSNKQID